MRMGRRIALPLFPLPRVTQVDDGREAKWGRVVAPRSDTQRHVAWWGWKGQKLMPFSRQFAFSGGEVRLE
jgi:hypothetical protein